MKKIICIALCLLLCACSTNKTSLSSSEVSFSSSEQEVSSKVEEELKEISSYKKDLEDGNYISVTYGLKNGQSEIIGVCKFDGENPKEEYINIVSIFGLSVVLDCKKITVGVNTADDVGFFTMENGEFSSFSIVPTAYENIEMSEEDNKKILEYSLAISKGLNVKSDTTPKTELVPKILYEDKYIKISFSDAEETSQAGFGEKGILVNLLIENKSSADITVQTRNESVNGYMANCIFSCEISSGKKAKDAIKFAYKDLSVSNLSEIKEIELSFYAYFHNDKNFKINTEKIIISPND